MRKTGQTAFHGFAIPLVQVSGSIVESILKWHLYCQSKAMTSSLHCKMYMYLQLMVKNQMKQNPKMIDEAGLYNSSTEIFTQSI